jgi:DNA-binding transcriptional LysR family regulator
LIERRRKSAPGVKVICQAVARERYIEALETGRADLAPGQIASGQSHLIRQYLFDDELTCLSGAATLLYKGDGHIKPATQ